MYGELAIPCICLTNHTLAHLKDVQLRGSRQSTANLSTQMQTLIFNLFYFSFHFKYTEGYFSGQKQAENNTREFIILLLLLIIWQYNTTEKYGL